MASHGAYTEWSEAELAGVADMATAVATEGLFDAGPSSLDGDPIPTAARLRAGMKRVQTVAGNVRGRVSRGAQL
ncbi:MAG: hypothetical protein U0172_11530 [Nitrospiraceae bacterium]